MQYGHLIRSYYFKFIKDCLPKILLCLKGSMVKIEKFYSIFYWVDRTVFRTLPHTLDIPFWEISKKEFEQKLNCWGINVIVSVSGSIFHVQGSVVKKVTFQFEIHITKMV